METMTTEFLAYLREDQDKRNQMIASLKPAVMATLKGLEITRVLVDFDGEGDSGQVNDPRAFKDQVIVALPAGSLGEDIVTLCYNCLEIDHDGWENNDGACGEFEFDVAEGTISLNIGTRVSDVYHESHEY